MIFCLDTNAFIEPWRNRYPIDVFPTFWETLDKWFGEYRIISPQEVLIEIKKVDDELLEWINKRSYVFRAPEQDVQEQVTMILQKYPRLVDTKRGRSIADPWVIAQAQVSSAIVVTEEIPSRGKSPKIPDVCEALKIPYTNILGLIREMGLVF